MSPLNLLFRDEDLLIVSKPPGMIVHRQRGIGRHEPVALQTAADQIGRYVYPVHRLDRNTSGILCFALSSEMAKTLQAILTGADARKEYLALVRGEAPPTFVSERPLTNARRERQPARSEFRTIATFSRCSLLAVRITSGRHHQIRRHLNHLAHHVIGDTTHGKGRINRWFREQYGLPRMFLHAWRLQVEHPRTRERLAVVDPLPSDLQAFLSRLPDVPAGLLDHLASFASLGPQSSFHA